MWAIRILTGTQAGQVMPLAEGKHTIGRGSTCDVKLASNSVSKEHASVLVVSDKIIISDLNSRNGTFVNGIRIQNQRLSAGDKVLFHDVMIDILQVPNGMTVQSPGHTMQSPAALPAWAGTAAVNMQPQLSQDPFAANGAQAYAQSPSQQDDHLPPPEVAKDFMGSVQAYLDNVAMPGIYAMAKAMPYRWFLGVLVAIYILVVTALSIFPIVSMTKKNIQAESIRRAMTIARNMRDSNKRFVLEHNDASIDIHAAELEEGVSSAYILNAKDGTVIAPAAKRGEYVNKPFVNEARREERDYAKFIHDSSLGVAIPISGYSPETDRHTVIAYAIVLYDVGGLAMTPEQTISLFVETLAISLLAGAVLFFFLFKIVEHPIELASLQLDDALREGRDDLKTDYQFPSLERLLQNVNSALSRIGQSAHGGSPVAVVINRDIEAANVVRMLPLPAITVSAIDDRVIATNSAFDRLVGGGMQLTGRPLTDIPDSSLQQNLTDLLPRMRSAIAEIALSEIPFAGQKYEVCGQAVMGASEPAYYLITLNPPGGN